MTDKEHALMMMMFTRQKLYIEMLIDILESRGIIEGDDVSAFNSATISDPDSFFVFQCIDGQYRESAKQLRLELPKLPPSPESLAQPQ